MESYCVKKEKKERAISLLRKIVSLHGFRVRKEGIDEATVSSLCDIIDILYCNAATGPHGFTHNEIEDWIEEAFK